MNVSWDVVFMVLKGVLLVLHLESGLNACAAYTFLMVETNG